MIIDHDVQETDTIFLMRETSRNL